MPFIDIHCHCLPGLDDGPADLPEALQLCRALVADGVHTAIATPHQLGGYVRLNGPTAVDTALRGLRDALREAAIPLRIEPGGEVRIDERIPSLLASQQISTLGRRGEYLLLELPHDHFLDPRHLVANLAAKNVTVIIAHPERNAQLAQRPSLVGPSLEAGALLQITAGSITGDFGRAAQLAAWHWLGAGCVTFVASDAHNVDTRAPRMTHAARLITQKFGPAAARELLLENPLELLGGNEHLEIDRAHATARHEPGRIAGSVQEHAN